VALGLGACVLVLSSESADAVTVHDEATFRAAWSNPTERQIDLAGDITLTCGGGVAQRNSATALTLDGHGHSITQTCPNRLALMVLVDASNAGASPVTFRNVTINSGDATPSVALTNSTAAARYASTTAGRQVNQVITVQVRKRQHRHRHRTRPALAAPLPAGPMQAVLRFTG
jgi:hypothetical protein